MNNMCQDRFRYWINPRPFCQDNTPNTLPSREIQVVICGEHTWDTTKSLQFATDWTMTPWWAWNLSQSES